MLLFGGIGASGLNVWDQTTWSSLATATTPVAFNSAMAIDPRSKKLLLLGANFGDALSAWKWSGNDWVPLPGAGPAANGSIAAANDTARQKVLVVGPSANGQAFTWEWDGSGWSDLAPSVAPPMRWRPTAAYDATRQRVVLYDGNDLWVYLP